MITPYNIAPDFVRKFRAGPSILDLFGKCRRAWALRYIAGHDSYAVTWAEVRDHIYDKSLRMYVPPGGGQGPAIAPRQRSTALGTEAHRIVESHYLGRAVAADWTTFPGQVAQAWLDVMPGPEACTEIRTETAISLNPPPDMDWNKTPTLEGTSDLLLKLKPEMSILADGWFLGDWKTTRSFQYAKTAAELYDNSQGILYPLAAMRRLGLDSIPCRWAYSITDPARRREARATDFVQTREHAEAAARPLFQAAAEMRAIYDAVAHMEPLAAALSVPATGAPSACEAYGGCPHSVERGGACTAPLEMTTGQRMLAERGQKACAPAPAVVPLEALLQRSLDQTRKERYMSPFQKKLQELQNAQAVVPAVAEAQASTRLDGETRVLDPQPVTPQTKAEVITAAALEEAASIAAADQVSQAAKAALDELVAKINAVTDAPPRLAPVTPEASEVAEDIMTGTPSTVTTVPRRGPGRPRGSRNKAPAAIAAVTVPMGDVSETEDDDGSVEVNLNNYTPSKEDIAAFAEKYGFDQKYNPVSTDIGDDAKAGPGPMPDPNNIGTGQDITLSQLATAAKAHGCRIVVRFDGLKEKAL